MHDIIHQLEQKRAGARLGGGQRRIDAQYRAAVLVIESRRIVRAAQHRAQEREWGRAA